MSSTPPPPPPPTDVEDLGTILAEAPKIYAADCLLHVSCDCSRCRGTCRNTPGIATPEQLLLSRIPSWFDYFILDYYNSSTGKLYVFLRPRVMGEHHHPALMPTGKCGMLGKNGCCFELEARPQGCREAAPCRERANAPVPHAMDKKDVPERWGTPAGRRVVKQWLEAYICRRCHPDLEEHPQWGIAAAALGFDLDRATSAEMLFSVPAVPLDPVACPVCGPRPRPCARCGEASPKFKCSKCQVPYCSAKCQSADWQTHRKVCALLRVTQRSPAAGPGPAGAAG